jgi:hypothetical protein
MKKINRRTFIKVSASVAVLAGISISPLLSFSTERNKKYPWLIRCSKCNKYKADPEWDYDREHHYWWAKHIVCDCTYILCTVCGAKDSGPVDKTYDEANDRISGAKSMAHGYAMSLGKSSCSSCGTSNDDLGFGRRWGRRWWIYIRDGRQS